MAVFSYKALNSHQLPVAGTIAADTPRQAREMLRTRGLVVQSMADPESAPRKIWSPERWTARYGTKLVATIRELATLLAVGIPLVEALDTVTKQHRGGFRTALVLLRDRISSGMSLAEAMAEQPHVFDPLVINMVEVGENSGTLETVLDQLAAFRERSLELKDRVVTALLYPAIVLGVSLCVTLFLMTIVVPMLLDNLLEAGRPLPLATRIVKGTSDLLLEYGWFLAAGVAGVAIILFASFQTKSGRRWFHRLVLRIPIVGVMARKQAIARIALVVSTLMKSGLTFLKAVEISTRSTPNLVLREALDAISREVSTGQEIGAAMERTGVFPPLVIQVFAVGQQSGRLEEMLDRLATDYDRQVSSLSARLAAALEPALILTLAVFVGFILFATILPILEAGNVL